MTTDPVIPQGMMFGIEIAIAVLIMLAMLLFAMLALKPHHRDVAAWHVWVGAGIQGLIYGAIVGFFIMPLRFAVMNGEVPTQLTGPTTLIALVILLALRRGAFAHLPFLGPQVKAYRRAMLRRTIEVSERRLAGLAPKPVSEGA